MENNYVPHLIPNGHRFLQTVIEFRVLRALKMATEVVWACNVKWVGQDSFSLVLTCAISTRMSGIRKRSNVGKDPGRFKMACKLSCLCLTHAGSHSWNEQKRKERKISFFCTCALLFTFIIFMPVPTGFFLCLCLCLYLLHKWEPGFKASWGTLPPCFENWKLELHKFQKVN